MGASESKGEQTDSENFFETEDTRNSGETYTIEPQCRTHGPGSGDGGGAGNNLVSHSLPETGLTANQESEKCYQPESAISNSETFTSNESVTGIGIIKTTLSDISEVARRTADECKDVMGGDTGHEIEEGCQGKAAVGDPLVATESRTHYSSSSPSGSSPSSKTRPRIELVKEGLPKAMILKYFTEPRSDSGSTLPAYYVSEEKYGKLWLECPEASEMDSCEHMKSGKFSQLCASNFIRLGPSLIGYPATSWIENGYPENSTVSDKCDDFELAKAGPSGVQIWVTEKSHPTPYDLKNDIFLKMCAVEEINRSDLMHPQRAYLTVDGNIEYYLNTGIQKEGILDLIKHIQQSKSFGLDQKEYSPTLEMVIDALSTIPQYVNNEQAASDLKRKSRGKLKRKNRKQKKSTNKEVVTNGGVETEVSCDESKNHSYSDNTLEQAVLNTPKGADISTDDLNRDGSALEVTLREVCIGSEQAFSGLSVDDNHHQVDRDSTKNDILGIGSALVRSPDLMSETHGASLDATRCIDKTDDSKDEKCVSTSREALQDSSGEGIHESPTELMLTNSCDLLNFIGDLVKTAENLVQNGNDCSSAPSLGTTTETLVVDSGTFEDTGSKSSHKSESEDSKSSHKSESEDSKSSHKSESEDSKSESEDDVQDSAADREETETDSSVQRFFGKRSEMAVAECNSSADRMNRESCHTVDCEAHDAVVPQGIEDICVSDVVSGVSSVVDSQMGSNGKHGANETESLVSRNESRIDEESSEETDDLESKDHDVSNCEETTSGSESSPATELDEEETYSETDRDTDSEVDKAETETGSTAHESSGKLSNSVDVDSELKAGVINKSSAGCIQENIRRIEKVGLSTVPDSLKDIGLRVVHPKGYDVVSRLSKFPDTYWLSGKDQTMPEPSVKVVKSSGEVALTLIEALEKTSSKPEGPAKISDSAQGASKPKSPQKVAQGASKPKSPQNVAQGASSSAYIPPWKRFNQKSPKKLKGLTNEKHAEPNPLAKLEVIAQQLFPAETEKTPLNSAAGRDGDKASSKEMDERNMVAQKNIPAFFGEQPSVSQGFVRHSLANSGNQFSLAAHSFAPHSWTDPNSQFNIDAHRLQAWLGATSPPVPAMPGPSNLSVVAVPSSSVAPAPPMGAIPVRPPYLPSVKPPEGKMVAVHHYSNQVDAFGCLVMKSLASMSLEQRTHAVNIICDVLNEGNNNALCQYTRLSGVRNGQDTGKAVFRMGPSHALETQQMSGPGYLSGQPLFSYGFPPNPSPRPFLPQRNPELPKDPSQSQQPLPASQKPLESNQKLAPASQNVAPNQNAVPPTQNKSLANQNAVPPTQNKSLANQNAVPPTQNKSLANQNAQKWKKASPKKKKSKTAQSPDQKPSSGLKKIKSKTSKKLAVDQKQSSASHGIGIAKNTQFISKLSKKEVQQVQKTVNKIQNSAATSHSSVPKSASTAANPPFKTGNSALKSQNSSSASQNPATKAPSTVANPPSKTGNPALKSQNSSSVSQNPATKSQNSTSAPQKSAPKAQNSSGPENPNPSVGESNKKKRQRQRKAKFFQNILNP